MQALSPVSRAVSLLEKNPKACGADAVKEKIESQVFYSVRQAMQDDSYYNMILNVQKDNMNATESKKKFKIPEWKATMAVRIARSGVEIRRPQPSTSPGILGRNVVDYGTLDQKSKTFTQEVLKLIGREDVNLCELANGQVLILGER